MSESLKPDDQQWIDILSRLSEIRESGDYTPANVDFIKENLQSEDDRIRAAAALATEGCLFEPYIIQLLISIVEMDSNDVVRKAAIQSLEDAVDEGISQGFEDQDELDHETQDVEEWDDYQVESLRRDYNQIKDLLLNMLQDDVEDIEILETALKAISGLGFYQFVRDLISDLYSSNIKSSRLAAIRAMGKHPHFWELQLSDSISQDLDKQLLLEAISASYSSNSKKLAQKIENVLNKPELDPEVITYALYSLTNINQTSDLGKLLQRFSLHQDRTVREAARKSIDTFAQRNFDNFLHDELGYSK
jgi:hypothetical protein